MKHLIICFLLFLAFNELTAQETPESSIELIAYSTGYEVKLRFAPTTMKVWKKIQQKGVIIERSTVMRGGKVLADGARQKATILTTTPLRPWQDKERWKELMERDDYAAIGAQAIFGELFIPRTISSTDQMTALVDAQKEDENRFGFGLFAADQSWEAAQAMGLAFVDKSVVPGEMYFYQVRPVEEPWITNGYISIATNETAPSPKLKSLEIEFQDKEAILTWDKLFMNSYYTSYTIERSDDGVNWEKRNSTPYVHLDKKGTDNKFAFYRDTFEYNNQPYFYRVSGNTPFGETGTPSDAVQGMGKNPEPERAPSITSVLTTDLGGFVVSWAYKQFDGFADLRGFKVLRATSERGNYEDISGLLPTDIYSFIDPDPLPSNYYKVAIIDQYGREKSSFSALAQPEDNTPPAPPMNVRGTILKDGKLILTWDKNTEADLLGYRVYLSNQKEAEFSQFSNKPILAHYFSSQVTLNTLNKEVYAQVVALDYRHNTSEFSSIATILRPDTIMPSKPLIKNIESTHDYVEITWINSSSSDVVRHELYRTPKGGTIREKIKEFMIPEEADTRTYRDENVSVGEAYLYEIVAIDAVNLSATSNAFEGRIIDNFIREKIEKVTAAPNRRAKTVQLQWEYNPKRNNISYFLLYRTIGTEIPRAYQHIKASEAAQETRRGKRLLYAFKDENLKMNTKYIYQLRAVYADGAQSPLSEPIEVNY